MVGSKQQLQFYSGELVKDLVGSIALRAEHLANMLTKEPTSTKLDPIKKIFNQHSLQGWATAR